MIDHSKCDHERTSKARAKCRRGDTSTPRATPKEVDFSKGSGSKAPTTPRDKDAACMICGVERWEYRGRDKVADSLLYVGTKCFYYIQQDPKAEVYDKKEKVWQVIGLA
jgi:hypothetical protein